MITSRHLQPIPRTSITEEIVKSFRVHISVYEAIKARDPGAARRAMAAHLDRLEERLDGAIAGSRAREDQAAVARRRPPRTRPRAASR